MGRLNGGRKKQRQAAKLSDLPDDSPVHGELLITQPSGAGIARKNVPANGIGGDQHSMSKSFMAMKRRAAQPPEQPDRIADFQLQIVIRHPHPTARLHRGFDLVSRSLVSLRRNQDRNRHSKESL